ncbi:MAG: M1 family metallopeptidase [Bacteroidetes bacterium]|nr:M1 family metallopeptidase [Bacteroidota bacterium]
MKLGFIRIFSGLIVYILFVQGSIAQSSTYPIPLELRKALSNHTRTNFGVPGINYWQNSADYVINASLTPEKALLSGKAVITYYNNSPDTLRKLVFNLYQDIFRKGNSRDWDIGPEDIHEGTKIVSLKIKDSAEELAGSNRVNRQGTRLIIQDMLIMPGSKKVLEVAWEVKLPEHRTIRMGKYNDSSLFVAYWYPQIAVYDDFDGWDMISYNGSVEFYNNFGNFQVTLSLPDNFMVWATGELSNPEEVYPKRILNRYEAAKTSTEVVKIVQSSDLDLMSGTKGKKTKKWVFHAENVPDFSFGAGIGFLWDGSSLLVDSTANNQVFIDAAYPSKALNFDQVAQYARTSIAFMSGTMPGIAFPYPKMTVFCNGKTNGGMETPMMANNSAPADAANSFGLTFHEIAHSYFPFYMGTNEKKYAWMDEGWASLWPHTLVDSLYPEYQYFRNAVSYFEQIAGKEMDIPPMVPTHLTATNYASMRNAAYVRPALAMYFLEKTIGKETFTLALQEYIHRWNGKHPLPIDFFRTIEQVAGIDLYWYFGPWFYGPAYPDQAIRKITNDRKVVIENPGGLPLPIELKVVFSDGSNTSIKLSAMVWNMHKEAAIVDVPGTMPIRSVSLGSKDIPDVDRKNNEILRIDQH